MQCTGQMYITGYMTYFTYFIHLKLYILPCSFVFQALDSDVGVNDDLLYYITGGSSGRFTIDMFSGEVIVDSALNREGQDVRF